MSSELVISKFYQCVAGLCYAMQAMNGVVLGTIDVRTLKFRPSTNIKLIHGAKYFVLTIFYYPTFIYFYNRCLDITDGTTELLTDAQSSYSICQMLCCLIVFFYNCLHQDDLMKLWWRLYKLSKKNFNDTSYEAINTFIKRLFVAKSILFLANLVMWSGIVYNFWRLSEYDVFYSNCIVFAAYNYNYLVLMSNTYFGLMLILLKLYKCTYIDLQSYFRQMYCLKHFASDSYGRNGMRGIARLQYEMLGLKFVEISDRYRYSHVAFTKINNFYRLPSLTLILSLFLGNVVFQFNTYIWDKALEYKCTEIQAEEQRNKIADEDGLASDVTTDSCFNIENYVFSIAIVIFVPAALLDAVLLFEVAYLATCEAKNAKFLLLRESTKLSGYDAELDNDIQNMSLQLTVEEKKFDVYNMMVFDRKLILSIVSSSLMHVIILIQFYQASGVVGKFNYL